MALPKNGGQMLPHAGSAGISGLVAGKYHVHIIELDIFNGLR